MESFRLSTTLVGSHFMVTCEVQKQELFTTNLRGKKNDIPSSGLLLTDWLQNLPEAWPARRLPELERRLHEALEKCSFMSFQKVMRTSRGHGNAYNDYYPHQHQRMSTSFCQAEVLPGQSISSQCSECAPALRSKTFTAPTARLQQTVPMEIKSRDLPKDQHQIRLFCVFTCFQTSCHMFTLAMFGQEKDSKHLPSIHVTPPALESPWWSNLYYTALLLTAGVLSLGPTLRS